MEKQIRLMFCSLIIFCMLGSVFCLGTLSTNKINKHNKNHHEVVIQQVIGTEEEEEDE